MIVGLLHPGEMGSAVGRVLQAGGHEVLWASKGRSEATRSRAEPFRDAGTVRSLAGQVELILSICPPHAALDVAGAANGFDGIYVDANAISPAHALEIAALHPRFVDGGIVGGPPREPGTKLYLSGSGASASEVAALFADSALEPRVVANASAVKMAYAAWSKGTTAMLLAIREVTRHFDVEEEWGLAAPELVEQLPRAEHVAAAGQPEGFHRAAAQVYRS